MKFNRKKLKDIIKWIFKINFNFLHDSNKDTLIIKQKTKFVLDKYNVIILFLLFIATVIYRFIIYSKTVYANGTDGYLYIIQLQSLIEKGHMHFPDASLIYPYLRLLCFIFKDYICSLKMGISILTGFFTVLIYLLSFHISRKKLGSIFIAFLTIFSPSITFFAMQFPKNFMGLVFFMFFLLFSIRYNIFLMGITFISTFITHRLTAGILLLFVFFGILFSKQYKILIIIAIAVLLLSIFLPGTLHISDLQRLKDLLSFSPKIAPYSFIQCMGQDAIHNIWIIELFFYYALFVFSLVMYIKGFFKEHQFRNFFLILLSVSCILVFPFFKFNITGAAYRFFLAFIPFSMLLGISFIQNIKNRFFYYIFSILLLLFPFSYSSYNPAKIDPPYSFYENIAERIDKFFYSNKKKPDLIVAHKSLAEMIDYKINIETLSWKPEKSYDKTKVWRIVKNIERWEIVLLIEDNNIIKKSLLPYFYQISSLYILVREDIWQQFFLLASIYGNKELKRRIFSWKNPYIQRPAYLMRFRE